MYNLSVISLFFDIYRCCCHFLPSNVSRQWGFQESLSHLRLRLTCLLWEDVLQFWIPQLFIKRQCDFASPEEYICLTDSPQRGWKQIYLPVLPVVLGLSPHAVGRTKVSLLRKGFGQTDQDGRGTQPGQQLNGGKSWTAASSGSLEKEALNCHR